MLGKTPHPHGARMPGESYEPMPLPPVPYAIRRRRKRVWVTWCILAAAALMVGGALGGPPLLVQWLIHHG